MSEKQKNNQSELHKTLKGYSSVFMSVGGFSFVINILMLVSPLYMLQLYDRVLSSGSRETLFVLTGIALFLLALLAILEIVRSRLMVRIGIGLDGDLNGRVFYSAFKENLNRGGFGNSQNLRDMDTVRQFFSGNTLFAFFDAPWTPLFIILIFLMHPWLGTIALLGAIIIFCLAILTEIVSRDLIKQAASHSIQSNSFATASLRNADVLEAMGMVDSVKNKWHEQHDPAVKYQAMANDRVGLLLGTTKAVRFTLQILILGCGGWLALEQVVTPGVMIAASIIMGRALAPVEQAIGAWRGFVSSRTAFERLREALDKNPDQEKAMALPRPEGKLTVDKLVAAPPGLSDPILKGIGFEVPAGECLGIIGPSACGKSTLGRVLTGVWTAARGSARLGGINVSSWDSSDRGQYMGYLPQDIELFDGTVAENIARLQEVDPDAVIKAATEAGCHDMILKLKEGYETRIGDGGCRLSAGQRQRLALARAIYGDPVLVVLDEPNSNLDTEGEAALIKAVNILKQRGVTTVFITHNIRIIHASDKLLVIKDGVAGDFGPTTEVLQKFARPASTVSPPPVQGQSVISKAPKSKGSK